jgi:hypothetical protein
VLDTKLKSGLWILAQRELTHERGFQMAKESKKEMKREDKKEDRKKEDRKK